jgi:hypothetical protein
MTDPPASEPEASGAQWSEFDFSEAQLLHLKNLGGWGRALGIGLLIALLVGAVLLGYVGVVGHSNRDGLWAGGVGFVVAALVAVPAHLRSAVMARRDQRTGTGQRLTGAFTVELKWKKSRTAVPGGVSSSWTVDGGSIDTGEGRLTLKTQAAVALEAVLGGQRRPVSLRGEIDVAGFSKLVLLVRDERGTVVYDACGSAGRAPIRRRRAR